MTELRDIILTHGAVIEDVIVCYDGPKMYIAVANDGSFRRFLVVWTEEGARFMNEILESKIQGLLALAESECVQMIIATGEEGRSGVTHVTVHRATSVSPGFCWYAGMDIGRLAQQTPMAAVKFPVQT